MTRRVVDGPAIIIGYEYRLQIEAESDLFPVGVTLRRAVSRQGERGYAGRRR